MNSKLMRQGKKRYHQMSVTIAAVSNIAIITVTTMVV